MKKFIEYSSPWALIMSFTLLSLFLSLISSMKIFESNSIFSPWGLFISLITLLFIMFMWLRDSTRESMMGSINDDMMSNLKFAVMLFLISEAFFFMSFFWMFMYSSMAPESGTWPPSMLLLPSFIGAPSLNTILLVSSSATVTMCHFESSMKNKSYSMNWMILTLILSLTFIFIQYMEYMGLPFSITSGVGGSIFFMATGFHGMHVIIGTIALMISCYLMYKKYLTTNSMVGLEMSIWYWHFVDAIWLVLYSMFYCWGH